MNLEKAIEESLDGLWNNRQYGGTSELPRKDYQPYSTSQGYSFPYQAGGNAVVPPEENPKATSIPWPLSTVENDLSDSFVYLVSAYNKMKRCLKENPSLKKDQRQNIKKLMKFTAQALKRIEFVGLNVVKIANIAE